MRALRVLLAVVPLITISACQGDLKTPTGAADRDLAAAKKCASPPCGKDDGGGTRPKYTFEFMGAGPLGAGGPRSGSTKTFDISGSTTLDVSFVRAAFPGTDCFISGEYTATLAIQPDEQDPAGTMSVDFFPTAEGIDGMMVKHFLHIEGSFTDPWFPPEVGDTTKVDLATWSLRHDTGRGKSVACETDSDQGFAGTATLTVTRDS